MIHQSERDALAQQIKKGDYQVASNIYQEMHMRYVNRRYLQRFIEGKNQCTGARAGSHQPLDMYKAVAEAIRQRLERDQDNTGQANEIRQRLIDQITRDTTPHQPVAL